MAKATGSCFTLKSMGSHSHEGGGACAGGLMGGLGVTRAFLGELKKGTVDIAVTGDQPAYHVATSRLG
jgi:hypothetical protein